MPTTWPLHTKKAAICIPHTCAKRYSISMSEDEEEVGGGDPDEGFIDLESGKSVHEKIEVGMECWKWAAKGTSLFIMPESNSTFPPHSVVSVGPHVGALELSSRNVTFMLSSVVTE